MTRLAARAGGSPDARARALDRAMGLVRRVRRPSARSFYAESAAALFGVPLERLQRALQDDPRRSTGLSGPPMQPSATVRSLAPLPQAQAELTMLLVDVPHLATLAERHGASEVIDDPRLRRVVQAVIDGAKDGRLATMSELLEQAEPQDQPLLHEQVFAGKYRAGEDASSLDVDPQVELQTLLHRCREEALDSRVRQLDDEYRSARATGDVDRQRELQQQRIALRRQQADLRQAAPLPPST